jgi:hypothetical protein
LLLMRDLGDGPRGVVLFLSNVFFAYRLSNTDHRPYCDRLANTSSASHTSVA